MSEIYRFEDLELDASVFQVRRNGEVIAVQPQVFDVLLYLLKNRDRVVSKDELLDQVWHGRFISETTLSSRIKAVRQLIGDSGDRQALIRTIRNRGFQFVGEVSTKLTDPLKITSQGSRLPDTGITTIAVLPFEYFGANSSDVHFGQGIAADIITLLARNHWLRVISRGSSFRFSAAGMSPQEIGERLGAGYLLMGRFMHQGTNLRIDAELADCASGAHLWSERYMGSENDLYALQDQIAQQIAAAMLPEIEVVEGRRAAIAPTTSLDGWGCCHKGFQHLYRFTASDLVTARDWFEAALSHDEDLAHAYAGHAYADIQLAFYGDPANRRNALAGALDAARKSVALDSRDAFNHFVLGRALSLLQRFSEAETELRSALSMNPSLAQAYFGLGFSFTHSGKPGDAIPLYEKAVGLSPQDPHLWTFHHMRSMAHFRLGDLDAAERFVRLAVTSPNATYWPFATLCALLASRNRIREASAIADRLLRMKPGYCLSYASEDFFFAPRDAFVEQYVAGLASAGI